MSIVQAASWLAMAVSLAGTVMVNYRNPKGFLVWVLSNIMWILIGLAASEVNWGQVCLYVVYLATSIQGYVVWMRKPKAA